MTGFFTKQQIQSTAYTNGKRHTCISCGLMQNCKSPKIAPYGNFRKGILNIGEAPGEIEDSRGKPWQGITGNLLQKAYRSLGIDLFEDCLNINAVNCRPMDDDGYNRTPKNIEIDCCRKYVLDTIKQYKPKIVVLLGNSAIYSLIGHRWKNNLEGVSRWRGWAIPDQDFGCWICPTFHPSYVERDDTGLAMLFLKQDLDNAIRMSTTPFPIPHAADIKIIEDLSPLDNLPVTRVVFDFETTGKKPHATGHRIICASVAYDADHCYTFMLPPTRAGRRPFTNLLGNPAIEKMGHNIKFEEAWSVVRLQAPVQNWFWDSMQAAHILDNRQKISGLKFQTYVNFGVIDYSSDIMPYLKADDHKDANAINHIHDLLATTDGKEKLLTYCGWDAIWEYRLAEKQIGLMGMDLPF